METPAIEQESLTIEEEYINTLHTRSHARFFFSPRKHQFDDPQQQQEEIVITPDVQRMMHKRTSSEIELAMAAYFDASAEASEICRQLLANITNTRSNYLSMDTFLASISDCATSARTTATATAMGIGCSSSNPFGGATRGSFRRVQDRFASILQAIRRSHGKVARRLRVANAVRRAWRACAVAACGAAAAASVAVPAHLLFLGLLVGPAAMALCPMALKRRRKMSTAAARSTALARLQEQLDTAAKGTYVMGRGMDTVSHLVARLSDGIERENAMARRCAERVLAGDGDGGGDGEGRLFLPVREMVSELRRSCSSSRKLAEELEEHVCLCLATIHRARVLVISEMSKQA
uniref:Uncharacterized protein n=1 Tax=Leersia perrieri TaxID=77586 RepID=A0A0D9W4X7_9ORYZ